MKWRDIPSSRSLKRLIQGQLDLVLPSVSGYSLVTIGELSSCFDYSKASVANIVKINSSNGVNVCADPHQLPLASDDIDAIFIPLQIEQSELPHQLLREVARVLRPGGKLILVKFNPYSIWGFYKLIFSKSGRSPWKYPFYRLGRIFDWISLLGLEVTVDHGLYAKLPGSEYSKAKDYLNSAKYSRFGAINFIVAEKKVKTLTMIKPNWKEKSIPRVTALGPMRKQNKPNSLIDK